MVRACKIAVSSLLVGKVQASRNDQKFWGFIPHVSHLYMPCLKPPGSPAVVYIPWKCRVKLHQRLCFFASFSRGGVSFIRQTKTFPRLSGHLRSNKQIVMTDFHLHEGAEDSNPNCVVRLNFLSQPNCMTLLPELNRVRLWKPAAVLEHLSPHMKTISHHRVRVNIALRLFIFQQPAADVFARLFPHHRSPRLSKQTELSASPKTTPEKINRFALALTLGLVDVGRVNMQTSGGTEGEVDRQKITLYAALAIAQWGSPAQGLLFFFFFLRRRQPPLKL